MALQIIVKNSAVSGKQPTGAQLANGEISLNYHADGPFLTCKDSAGTVRRITGVWVNATAPGNPTPGEMWLDISLSPPQLKVYQDGTATWVPARQVYAASTTVAGVVELSTNDETQAGTEALVAVTPASLQSKLSDSVNTTSSTTIATSTAVKTAKDAADAAAATANAALPKSGGIITGNLEIGTTGSLTFEGSTADGFETQLAVVDPTADRTITLPNVSGTVVTTGDSGTVTSTMLATDLALSGSPTAQTQAAGTSNTTLATTAFVMAAADAARQGLTVKQACRVATTANISLSGTQTVDGVAVIAGDRVLVKNQTTATENGIYVCAASSWSRATDFDADADLLDGAFTFVEEGSSNADSGWVLTTNGPITVGVTSLAFAQFSGAGQITAGSGLAKTANTLSVASGGITSDMIADGAIVDADINASAAIAGTKISPDFGSQNIVTTGNVGIGMSSPNQKLDIAGGSITTDNVDGRQIGFAVGDTFTASVATANYGITRGASGTDTVGLSGYAGLSFYTNALERASIDSSGRLLLGTSSARSNFFNTSTFSPGLQLEGTTDQNRFVSIVGSNSGGAGGTLILASQKSGTVGGNAIVSDNGQLGVVSFHGNDGTEFIEAARIEAFVDGTPGANDMPGRLVFSTTADASASPTEAMRINSAQELLVGYTADNGAYKLQVNSQIFATSATIATSDGRYKDNVTTLDGCADLIRSLRPVSFDWKPQQNITRIDEDGNETLVREGHNFPAGTQVGFIAQEVQDVLTGKPWLGSIIKENVRPAITDADGTELAPEEQFYGIAEGNLIAVLTSALKDALSEIDALKARVAALEAP